jgi:hypothetical protein
MARSSSSATVIAVLALLHGIAGTLRAMEWFDLGSDLMGQGLLLLPAVGVLAFARGAIVALLALLFLLFALGAFLRRGWAWSLGIVLSVVNMLLVLSLAVQAESVVSAVPWAVIPVIMLIYLLSPTGRDSLGGHG